MVFGGPIFCFVRMSNPIVVSPSRLWIHALFTFNCCPILWVKENLVAIYFIRSFKQIETQLVYWNIALRVFK